MRIAVYCRVSTDKDDQINSLESQKRFFREYIERNPSWELTKIYSDEGISGTSTKKRHSFNRMIDDACEHRFELIITKEISRFARNTLDSIYYTRKLKNYGVGVIFMNDNINTLDPDAELRLTIMSSIAQEESRKISERVKWGQKRRMEQGVVFGRNMLGYDIRSGTLFINKNGAETVKLIFHKYLNEGKGTHKIAQELRESGIPTASHMKNWNNTVISRILRNEKYCGDLIQKKTYTPSYLSHEKKPNRGYEDFVVIRNHHEPIISRDLFEKTQQELERRSVSIERRSRYSSRYCLSGKIKCGNCGSSFVSRLRKRKNGEPYMSWRCYEAVIHGKKHSESSGDTKGCDNSTVSDGDIKQVLLCAVRELIPYTVKTTEKLINTIQRVLNVEHQENRYKDSETFNDKRQALLELYLNNDISIDDFRLMNKKIVSVEPAIKKEPEKDSFNPVNTEMREYIKLLSSGEIWDDAFYRNLIESVIVHTNNTIVVRIRLQTL